MTVNHSHFEVLCALAASGQLTSSELAELHEHAEVCPSCSDRLVEMTQVSAELFCVRILNQPRIRMPNGMVERFIARANSEGVPLNPRAASVGFSGPAVTAAFLLALLLISAILHFASLRRSNDETTRGNAASDSAPINEERQASSAAPRNVTPDETQTSRIPRRQNASGFGPGTLLSVSRSSAHGRLSRVDSAGLEQSQFDLTVYSRSLAMFHRPFFVTAKLGQDIQWAPARFGKPRFPFAQHSEFAKDDPPRLLAEYEHRAFAPWGAQDSLAFGPADVQVLRRDFDPNAYRTVLNPDFKRNLPAFQFTSIALQ
jgi:hypothetical protein